MQNATLLQTWNEQNSTLGEPRVLLSAPSNPHASKESHGAGEVGAHGEGAHGEGGEARAHEDQSAQGDALGAQTEDVDVLRSENADLKELCQYLDEDRVKAIKLSRDWQQFGWSPPFLFPFLPLLSSFSIFLPHSIHFLFSLVARFYLFGLKYDLSIG